MAGRTSTWAWFVAAVTTSSACNAILGDDFEAVCDGLGDCGACWECAKDDECEDERNACLSSPPCAALIQCHRDCDEAHHDDPQALERCLLDDCWANPDWLPGHPTYQAMAKCADCLCINSCNFPPEEC